MSRELMIAGNSGSGKSSSIRTLDPSSTFIINCGRKELSFPKARLNYRPYDKASGKGNLLNTNVFDQVNAIIPFIGAKMPHIKTLVIDDMQFTMSASVMKNASEKGYEKWTELAKGVWNMSEAGKNQRDDLTVVTIEHLETNYDDMGAKWTKVKTAGKLVDNVINLDGLFATILYSEAVRNATGKIEYKFRTHTNGSDTCKSPMGMFEEDHIPNDLQLVLDRMDEYYGVNETVALT